MIRNASTNKRSADNPRHALGDFRVRFHADALVDHFVRLTEWSHWPKNLDRDSHKMQLDSLTLMIPGAFATALASLYLFGAWFMSKDRPALLWWAAANGINAVGVTILTTGFALKVPLIVMVGAGLITFVPGLIWGGVRRFNNLTIPVSLLTAGPVVWAAIVFMPLNIDHQKWSTLAVFVTWCMYLAGSIWILWGAGKEKLNARWPLVALLAFHAVVFLGAGCEIVLGTFDLNEPPRLASFFGAYHFETIIYSMGTAIFMGMLYRERAEIQYINAARRDLLTGTVNHGAWLDGARRLLERCQRDGLPLSMIMFDLDHFKAVNDNHGHLAGDRVLCDFANTVREALRPSDFFGRYGGEEFVVVLPGATIETAAVIADRVRRAFADSHRFLDGKPLNATVSAGIAEASENTTLEAIIEASDKAMYAAKNAGRNCIKRAGDDHYGRSDRVIRVA